MAGLLDFFNPPQGGLLGEDDRRRAQQSALMGLAQGLLGAGQPSRMPVGFGAAVGQGLGGYAQAQGDAMDAAVKSKMAGLQFDKANMEMQQAKDKRAAQSRLANYFPGTPPFGQGVQVADASGTIGASQSPAKFDLASIMQQPGAFGDLVAAGYDPVGLLGAMQKTQVREKLGPGDILVGDGGQKIAENPALPKAPTMRTRMEGGMEIQEEYQPDGTWKQVGKGPRWQPPQGDPNARMTNVNTLRKEFQGRPEIQSWQTVQPILASMEDAAPRNTRASDLNLVYGLGKIMDPNSVVREGEMVMVKDTSSLPGWLVGEINRVNGGAALQPATRNSIMAEARSRAQNTYAQASNIAGQYGDFARRYNLPPDDVVFGLSPFPTTPTPAGNGGALPDARVPAPPPGFRVVGGKG